MAVRVRADRLEVDLADGRRVSVPLSFYPTLLAATPRERARWEYWPDAIAIEWPVLDLQLSVESIVAGRRERVLPPGFRQQTINALRAAGLALPPGW